MEEEASHVYIRYPLSTVPRERYRLSNICTDAELSQTERYHPILCAKEKTDNIVVITQSYKNDVETFRDYTKHLRKWLDGDMEGPLFDDQFDGMVRIHGSGGYCNQRLKVLLPHHC